MVIVAVELSGEHAAKSAEMVFPVLEVELPGVPVVRARGDRLRKVVLAGAALREAAACHRSRRDPAEIFPRHKSQHRLYTFSRHLQRP